VGSQYVTDGLKTKLAEIAGTIRQTGRRLKGLAAERAIFLGTLQLFEAPGGDKPDAGTLGI
jgi:hypothetical protein